MMEEENSRLVVPKNPRGKNKLNWGWIATPAAAVAGILFGMSLPMTNSQENTSMMAQLRDTVYVGNETIDTVYITKTIEKQKIVKRVIWKDRVQEHKDIAQTAVIDSLDFESECTSIACDGIDYAFFK
jgi:carbamoylphosphate synthase small subunit